MPVAYTLPTAPVQRQVNLDPSEVDGEDISFRGEIELAPTGSWATVRGVDATPVSYTHLTLPTNREV